MGEKQIPMFFTCFNDVDRAQKLHLPQSWCSFMGGSLPSKAFLRNRHGDSWEVRVTNYQNSDEFWLEKGWSTFIEQNKLAYNDLIVFKYDGKSRFDFKLFDEKNNEKEYVRIPNLKRQRQPALEERQDMQPEPEDDDWEEDDDDFQAETTISRRKVTRKQAPRISEEDEEAIFQSGVPRPNNPYFLTKRRDEREQLYIPKEVVQDFNLTFPEQIGIHDEKGHEWKGKVHKWADGRIWFSEGWKALCKWNNVKRDDWCIIEIVRPELPEDEIFLKTHLVPAAALRAASRS